MAYDNANSADENAPVFVRDFPEFVAQIKPIAGNRITKRCVRLFSWVMALYMVAFAAAESWLPGLYRAWVNLFLPLAEFVGSLTPRAGRITGDLISHGYPERAEFALHAIAMSRVLVLPVFVSVLAAPLFYVIRAPKTHLVVACTRATPTRIFLFAIGGSVITLCIIFAAEFWGEDFQPSSHFFAMGNYHRSNVALAVDMGVAAVYGFLLPNILICFIMACKARFHIVEKAPE